MKGNATAKVLRTLGTCIIVVGILGAFCAGLAFPAVSISRSGRMDSTYNWGLVVAVITGSIISGAMFYGIAEIINLLQRIEKKLCVDGGESEKLKDIESNLPTI